MFLFGERSVPAGQIPFKVNFQGWVTVMGKVVFLDMDGTLIDFQQHMSQGTRLALQQASKNGHKMVLCTDRTYTGIYPWVMKIPFDAVVASAGAYVRCEDEVIVHHMLDNEKVSELTRMLWQHGAATLAQGVHARYAVAAHEKKILDFFRWLRLDGNKFLNGITVVENPSAKAALENILYFTQEGAFREVLPEILEKFDGYFHVMGVSYGSNINYSGMIGRKGVTKASAMADLLDYWKIPYDNSMAIGDGSDDLDMIQFASVGIAMENGIPELKDLADYMTTSVENEGVANAFRDFRLI